MITEAIKADLKKKKVRFFANDNIPDLDEEDLAEIEDELTENFESVLNTLLIDWENDPNSKGTPRRLAKMYLHELFKGRYYPRPDVTAFPNEGEHKYKGMLVVRAEIKSMCSHHHQPVKGICYIGIIPGKKVMGLSKYIRLAQWCARRGTLQEELCNMIANEINKATESKDIGVYLKLSHGCCENRGVSVHDSTTQTTVLRGEFDKPDVKQEFFDNIKIQENVSR